MQNNDSYHLMKFKKLDLSRYAKSLRFADETLGQKFDLSFLVFHDWWNGASVEHRITRVNNLYKVELVIVSNRIKFQIEVQHCEYFTDELKARVYGMYFERTFHHEIDGAFEPTDKFFNISLN